MKCCHKASGGNDAAVKAPPINSKFPRTEQNQEYRPAPPWNGWAQQLSELVLTLFLGERNQCIRITDFIAVYKMYVSESV